MVFKKIARQFLVKQLAKRNLKIVSAKSQAIRDMHNLNRKHHLDVNANEYTNDFIRLSLLDLAVEEIKSKKTAGNVAELGVYQGHFASVLNGCFPDKKLYLFDTFEGFSKEEEEYDRDNFGLNYKRDFANTSEGEVIKRMPNPQRCVVKKGLFPGTAVSLENETFCFVSIDTDLYTPIKAGLEFFYDRLAPGGFIFVHDYANTSFPGSRRAVNEFWEKRGIPFVPVCDWMGSAIIRK